MTGQQLKGLIISHGLTAKDVATSLWVSQQTMTNIFQKDSVPALYEYAIKYLLGVAK